MLGGISVLVRSDLEIPSQIAKFLSLYLLFDIGIRGGEELFHSGFNRDVINVMITTVCFSFFIPFIIYKILRIKLDKYNAGAIAASYGSISAVTFITATTFLEANNIAFNGYMVAGMALMESPAIIAGLIIIKQSINEKKQTKRKLTSVFYEAFTNSSVLLLIGSLIIGFICGEVGEKELKPFVTDIFKGMLCLYMLDMGIVSAGKLYALKKTGIFLTIFALLYPLTSAIIAILTAYLLELSQGNALLLTILVSSGSYIAVPAAMRLAVPEANMSLLLPMTLGVTFTFNIIVGIPLYYYLITCLN